jgi:hypothetical protein
MRSLEWWRTPPGKAFHWSECSHGTLEARLCMRCWISKAGSSALTLEARYRLLGRPFRPCHQTSAPCCGSEAQASCEDSALIFPREPSSGRSSRPLPRRWSLRAARRPTRQSQHSGSRGGEHSCRRRCWTRSRVGCPSGMCCGWMR